MWLPVVVVSLLSLGCAYSELNDDRIAGGKSSSILEHPYQVSLQDEDGHFCGGSIISPRIIVTASHCLRRFRFDPKNSAVNNFTVRLGSTYNNKGGIVKGVETFLVHPKYNPQKVISNDIALLKLKSDVIESAAVQYLEVATELPIDGTQCMISGWGRTQHGVRSTPDVLQSAVVDYISTERCQSNEMYGTPSVIDETMICCKAPSISTLQGDSGGPLVSIDEFKLVGVSSFVPGYDTDTYPDVYTKVPMFAQWIHENSKTL